KLANLPTTGERWIPDDELGVRPSCLIWLSISLDRHPRRLIRHHIPGDWMLLLCLPIPAGDRFPLFVQDKLNLVPCKHSITASDVLIVYQHWLRRRQPLALAPIVPLQEADPQHQIRYLFRPRLHLNPEELPR